MLVFDMNDGELLANADGTEYAYCALQPSEYLIYDRAKFIELLEHWGWYGSEDELPAWYRENIRET
jgi:hypothetical protein